MKSHIPFPNAADFASQLGKHIRSKQTSLKVLLRLYAQSDRLAKQFVQSSESRNALVALDNLSDQQSRLIRLAVTLPAKTVEDFYAKAYIWRHEAPEIECAITDMTDADAIVFSLFEDLGKLTEPAT